MLDSAAVALQSQPRQQTLLVSLPEGRYASALDARQRDDRGRRKHPNITLDRLHPASQGAAQLVHSPRQQTVAGSARPISSRRDFSTYLLRLVNSTTQAPKDPFEVTEALTGFDPQLAEVKFPSRSNAVPISTALHRSQLFAGCRLTPPPINYLAKDYGSFRTLILDRLNQLLPTWGGTSEADLGVALAELIAYRAII